MTDDPVAATDPLDYALNCMQRVRESAQRMAAGPEALEAEMTSGRAKRAYTSAQLGSWAALVSLAVDVRRLADVAEHWAGNDPPVMLVPPPT